MDVSRIHTEINQICVRARHQVIAYNLASITCVALSFIAATYYEQKPLASIGVFCTFIYSAHYFNKQRSRQKLALVQKVYELAVQVNEPPKAQAPSALSFGLSVAQLLTGFAWLGTIKHSITVVQEGQKLWTHFNKKEFETLCEKEAKQIITRVVHRYTEECFERITHISTLIFSPTLPDIKQMIKQRIRQRLAWSVAKRIDQDASKQREIAEQINQNIVPKLLEELS